MPKQRKRKVKASKAIQRSQASNIYTLVMRLCSKELSPLDDYLMKHTFLEFDGESPWELSSNCKIFDSGTGYHVRLLRRGRVHDKQGSRKTSEQYATIIEAENNAFEYRYGLESKQSKIKLDMLRSKFESILEGKDYISNATPVLTPKRQKLGPALKKSYAMSGSHHLNTIISSSMNPNNCPSNLDFLSEINMRNMFAAKIQRCVRSVDIRRAAKKIKNAITNQTYRSSIIKYLSKYLGSDTCEMLIIGSEDSEVYASFSQYDKQHATLKARHIVEALRHLVIATENKQKTTWLECCEKSIASNFDIIKRARTIADWYLDIHATNKLQFRRSSRGRESHKAKSPFAEDEFLMVQLKGWARKDIEHLTIKKAGAFINYKLLSDWSASQLSTYKISYPVSDKVVSRWLNEAGFKYTIHKKCYYVDIHEDDDVVADRNTYLKELFTNEILEHCWIQMPRWKLDHYKYNKEWDLKGSDITTKMSRYIEKHRVHFYDEKDVKMIELHVDDMYTYDIDGEKSLPILGPYGGNTSVRISQSVKPILTFGQDEAIFRSSQLNESCWQIDGITPLRTKGLGVGLMVSAMVSRAFGFGMEISDKDLLTINELRVGKKYADEEAATYLYGSSSKKTLLESPFVRCLEYGQGKDGYWTYKHMVLQIEDCTDCLLHLYPQFKYRFELDHSSGHNAERPDGLTTTSINLGWGGKQRKMRDSTLSEDDIGPIKHAQALKAGDIQSMVFTSEIPPIFDPTAPKFDQILPETKITRNLTAVELRKVLEDKGLNTDGKVAQLKHRAIEADIPITETTGKLIPGYIGKPKGALQIAAERGFIDLDGKFANGKKATMHGISKKDTRTGVKSTDKTTSIVSVLKKCSDFKNEESQMKYILTLLGVDLRLTPKCHPEIAGIGIEYAWGYAKLRFRRDFNDAIAMNLRTNVLKSIDRSVVTIDRIRKFARKAREYKLTYSLLIHEADGKDATAMKDEIEHITKLFKVHRSAIDSD